MSNDVVSAISGLFSNAFSVKGRDAQKRRQRKPHEREDNAHSLDEDAVTLDLSPEALKAMEAQSGKTGETH